MAETRSSHVVAGEKKDVVVSGKTLEKNDGTISVTYRPGPGDKNVTEVFGHKLKAGESTDIPARYADKVRGNPYLQMGGEKSFGDDKPKDEKPEPQEEVTFEQNVARERSAEYLEGRPFFAAPPGDAERVARAQEQARELQAATDDEDKDKDKPRRGRKPNE